MKNRAAVYSRSVFALNIILALLKEKLYQNIKMRLKRKNKAETIK